MQQLLILAVSQLDQWQKKVSEAEELQRVIPLVEAVQKRFDCWISVDTSKAIVMQEAAERSA